MGDLVELVELRHRKVENDRNGGDGGDMNNYATHQDLDDFRNQLNTSLRLTEKNIKMAFYEERENHRKYKDESKKWIVGTGLTITTIILTFIKLFVMS